MRVLQKIGLFIFLPFIGFMLYYLLGQSIRLDEAQTIWVATKPIGIIAKYIAEDVHLPLYFFLIHFWIQLFGDNIWIVRIPSFLFYLLTLFSLYHFCEKMSDKAVAFLTVLLFSLSPFVIWYSFEARMYTMLTLGTTLSHIFFLKFINSDAKEGKLGYFLSSLFGLYTHYFFIFLIVSQGLYVLFLFLKKVSTSRFLISHIRLVSITFILFLPWVFYLVRSGLAANSQPLVSPPSSFNLLQTFAFFIFGFQTVVAQSIIVSLWPLVILLLFIIFQKRTFRVRNVDYLVVVTFIPTLLIFTISQFKPIFLSRYLIFTIPTFFFLISSILLSFSRRVSKVLVVGTIGLIIVFAFYQAVSVTTPVKENYREVSMYLSQQVKPMDIVVVSAPFTVYPIEYYYRGTARIDTVPQWDRFTRGAIPNFSQDNLLKQLNFYKGTYERMFVVFSYDQGYESKIKDYLDHNFERLRLIRYSSDLELRVYKFLYN